jgi:hypothetical protein
MMKITHFLGILGTVFLLFSCQDPIFWMQVAEGKTPQHNLTKNALVFDVDATGTHLYAIMGGWLYTRPRSSVTWRQIDLGGLRAYSLDVIKGKIGMFDAVYAFDFTTETLGAVEIPRRPMVFFDKLNDEQASQFQPDQFDLNGKEYSGRYLGVLGVNVVSTVAVFSSFPSPDNWRNPRSVYDNWLIAGPIDSAVVGITSGTDFSPRSPISVRTARSVIDEGFIAHRGDVAPTVALVGITSGYREIFINLANDEYGIREPLTSVNDVNAYRASKMTEAAVIRFVYRSDVLFALTSNMGLWTMEKNSGQWTWE